MSDGAALGPKALEQIRQMLRDQRAQYQNPEPHRPRYTGTQTCGPTYAFVMLFNPSDGSAVFELTYKSVTDTITVSYNETPHGLRDLIDAHPQFVASGVKCLLVDFMGNLNQHYTIIEMPAGTRIRWSGSGLVQGSGERVPEFRIYACRGREGCEDRWCRPPLPLLPSYPCEDSTTAVKLCCISATVYDCRCWFPEHTYGIQYRDHSPGDILGMGRDGEDLINCPETGYNTNLEGRAAFLFPGSSATTPDGLPPFVPCPTLAPKIVRDWNDGADTYEYRHGIQVSWRYNCDTGQVRFWSTWIGVDWWSGNSFKLGYSEVFVAPDWYLSGEVTIPFSAADDAARKHRFSVKLKLTCEPADPCQDYECFPRCLAKTCDETASQSALFLTVTSGAACCLDGTYQFTWNGSAFYSDKIGDPFLATCGYVEVWYQCDGSGTFQRRIKITDVNGAVSDTTSDNPGACSGTPSNFDDTFNVTSNALTPLCFNNPPFYLDTVTFDIFTNN